MKKILKILLVYILFLPIIVSAKENKVIDIHLFYSSTCPHCKNERIYLEGLQKTNENIKVHLYEVSNSSENSALLDRVQELIKGKSSHIPYTVIGNKYRVGFNNSTKLEIESIIKAYEDNDYVDIVSGIIDGSINEDNIDEYLDKVDVEVDSDVDIPLLGKVDPKKVSLPLLAIIIGLVDGFNPCAMWILIFLISMLIGMKDKKRMWYLGSLFIATSAIIYLLFMVAWLNIVIAVKDIRWVQILIAIVALIGALVNIVNYLKEVKKKDNGCQVVDDKKRKRIFAKIKKYTHEKSLIIASIGVIALAISVNVIELACSAGLPILFTNILSLNNVSIELSSIYILIYIIFFMLDDLIVFFIAMFTLQVTGITTKYTKYTHLIGGLIMLIIGILLIIKPEWVMFNF